MKVLFYLTSPDKVNLIDFVEAHTGLIPRKLIGSFSFIQFIRNDMRKYSYVKFLVIDRNSIAENDEEFIGAIQSFQTMNDARIIVIKERIAEDNSFIEQLLQVGVTNIVMADETGKIQAEILECLSEDGMKKYLPQEHAIDVPENDMPDVEEKIRPEIYNFNAENVIIAVAGSQRRVGTTTTAINLAHWIKEHGGTVCYVENHSHEHLKYILKLYADEQVDNHYVIDGVDYYYGEDLDKNYNFIIHDCGELEETPQVGFTEADLRLLCCSAMPYEIPLLKPVIEKVKDTYVEFCGMPAPQEIQELLRRYFDISITFSECSSELFNARINDAGNEGILRRYIG